MAFFVSAGLRILLWAIDSESSGFSQGKCPEPAGDPVGFPASCGGLVQDNGALAGFRQDQVQESQKKPLRAA